MKKNRTPLINKTIKRAVSAITALAMFSGFVPLEELPHDIKLPHIELATHAARRFPKDPSIQYYDELIDYAESYAEYPEDHHENDIIEIAISNGLPTDKIADFVGIGTEDNPFAGTIVINSNSYENVNIQAAFFDYVYDHVQIQMLDSSKVFTINTINSNSGAVFANHVVHDTRSGITYDPDEANAEGSTKQLVTPATWNIKLEDFSGELDQGASPSHSSIIGEMGAGAKVTVSVIDNSSLPFTSSLDNVGSICGTMKASSNLTVQSVSGSNIATVNATSCHAGGLVGEMEPGSELTVQSIPSTATITAGGYAGGLVGKNDSATVTISGTPVISNTITGVSGAGGAFGYYKPIMTSNAYSLNLDTYSIGSSNARCQVSSSNGAGGFFGVLDNPGGTITLSGTSNKTVYTQGNDDNTVFGGIIGSYKANSLEDTLSVSGSAADNMLTVNTSKSGNLSFYGGIIGKIDGAYFANVSNVNVNASAANDEYFGGVIACADSAYVYMSNSTLTASSYRGGALVGHTSNGVVHIAGVTNITNATSEGGDNYGQIVGYRDSALVFADSTWDLTRSSSTVSADDIGSWGEVIRFKSSDFTIDSVLNTFYNPYPDAEASHHYATLKGASFSGEKIALSSKSTFATAALNMQLNGGTDTDVLKFADKTNSNYATLKSKSIVMTKTIDLSNTGLSGLTRDNPASDAGIGQLYEGAEFDGGGYTLTLAIGAGYEGKDSSVLADASGKGKIYRHKYNGIFGETVNNFTVKNLTVTGKVHTFDRAGETEYYVGTIAGKADAAFNANSVTVNSSTSIVYGTNGDKDTLYVGGLVGAMTAPGTSKFGATTYNASATTADCTISAAISGNASKGTEIYIGGISGYVGANGSITVNNVKITNTVTNTGSRENHKIGGLFAVIDDGTNTLSLNGLELSGLKIKGGIASSGSMGGLLGYSWDGVTATFNDITISSCELDNNSTIGNQAALVYTGSGYWQFNSVEIDGLTLTGSAASSLGVLINKAYSASKAMYLELPKEYSYTIDDVSGTAPTLYDELAVYTIMPDNSIESIGNSVISINTYGTTSYGSQTDSTVNMTSGACNTYQNQVTDFNKVNPNARYYYNVDNYIGKSNTGSAALYLWSVYQYADSTIQSHIATTAPTATFSGNLDLDGYSYYPVDVSGTVNLQGKLGLHNKEIEDNEKASSGGSDSFVRSTLSTSKTQHYLMHAGLFRDVSGTINVNGVLSISGNVTKTGNYCGALICGTISGTSETNAVVNTKGGSVSLAGITINEKDDTYSPLLINKASTYVTLNIYNVSALASAYSGSETVPPLEEGESPTTLAITKTAATSLIGMVGSDSAEKIEVTFSNIKLDARTAEGTLNDLTDVYGTKQSIFTNSTLLHSLTYSSGSGSFGTYNYEYSEDWTSSTVDDVTTINHDGNVTYGKELSDPNSKNYKKEFWYNKEIHSSTSAHYTDPSTHNNVGNSDASAPYDFSGFRPYVYVWGMDIGDSMTKHQLNVNHESSNFSGCGTYNDPYVITKGNQLEDISNVLSGNEKELFWIYYPNDPSDMWCNAKTDHSRYEYHKDEFKTKEGTTVAATTNGKYYKQASYIDSDGKTQWAVTDATKGTTIETSVIRKYLAGAYYYLDSDIEITDSNFGLGSNSNDNYVFRGVISGNEKTITIKTGAPLIRASNGCVVRKLTVAVGTEEAPVSFSLAGTKNDDFSASGGCGSYGAVIGRVMGGDNILDEVTVDVSNVTVTPTTVTPVGGYIGVIVNGGVFFRSMNKVTNKTGFGTTGNYAENNMSYLYCNPLIGRVINGFAVNETNKYSPYESGSRTFGDNSSATGNKTSLSNGNKNYSITDVNPNDTNKLSVSGTAVAVPNSQAFFIMSLIVNSGMGASGATLDSGTKIGYYGANHTTRHANYNHVGTSIAITATTTEDYLDYASALTDTNSSPYLISQYTTGDDVKTLGSGTGFKVTVSDTIILPDGYKGIGNIYQNDANLRLALSEFDGGGKSISQNTIYYSYNKDTDNKKPYIGTVHGFGLFNYVNNATFKDCILTGNVKTRQYNSNGTAPNCIEPTDFTALKAGMLIGSLYMGGSATITDVYLQNTYTEGASEAAGMIGFLINTGQTITITNTASKTTKSEGIRVSAGTSAAGLIARQGDSQAAKSSGAGAITINMNNRPFDFVSIISRYNGSTFKEGDNDWAYGVGGLVGIARGGGSSITIRNVIIGSDTETSGRVVACEYEEDNTTTQGKIYVGALVGVANKAPITATDCNIYNVSARSSKYASGVLGWGGTSSGVTLTRFTIKNTLTTNKAKIYSSGDDGNAGCVIGFCKGASSSDHMGTLKITNSTIEGYEIEAANAGAVLGNWQSYGAFSITDSTISNCSVTYSKAGGGIAGELTRNTLSGYNIRISGITLTKKGTETAKEGYLVGNRKTEASIKFVGIHRTGTVSPAKLVGSATANSTTGLYNTSNLYGSGGYVIFADYDGASLTPSNTALSQINYSASTHVSGYGASPYVTINPALTLDSNIGLLTGDAISSDAVNHILTDTSNRKYTVADLSYFLNGTDSSIKTDVISTFQRELGDVIKTKVGNTTQNKSYDFPMLVVNNTNTADEVINKYLNLLTNTDSGVDFSSKNSSINQSTNIGTVTIRRCTYDQSTEKYTIANDNKVCLKLVTDSSDSTNMKFQINTNNSGNELYDTAVSSGQFTLIDIAFKDPTTSSNPKVVYHLYVPVIVKKLVEYNFDISVLSGTSYDKSLYGTETDDVRGRALLENLGAPVTFEFEYSYHRTVSEWNTEGADYRYNKYLSFLNKGNYHFGSNVKALLVDMNSGESYYLNNWMNAFTWNDNNDHSKGGILDLQHFSNSAGTDTFKPMKFSEMITAQGLTADDTITERYYLTIYTQPFIRPENDNSTQVAHYTVTSEAFSDSEHPSRRIDCEAQTNRQPHNSVHLFIGDFYTNEFSVTTITSDRKMSSSNKTITVELNSTLDIVNSNTRKEIGAYLGYSDITLFQSFLVKFEKYITANALAETGISAIDECSVAFDITKTKITTTETSPITISKQDCDISRNFIELQNHKDLSADLRDSSISINAIATMNFNSDDTRNAQFPKASDSDTGIGALVVGASNLSSLEENTAYSSVSKKQTDLYTRYYYRTSDQAATLKYYADYSGATKTNQKGNQLGVNARELEEDNKSLSKMYTEVRYDASELLNNDKIEYIKCVVKLYQKQDDTEGGYTYVPVPINKYLNGLTVNGTKEAVSSTYSANDTTSTEFTYVYTKAKVEQFQNEENIYKIPIVFDVITGKTTGFKGDTDSTYIYANYKVEVTVSAFDKDHSSDTTPWTDYMPYSCPTADYVIYTNARVYTDRITTS